MKKLVFTVFTVFTIMSTFAHAAEFKFVWKGTIPAATTYIHDTILHHPKFNISDYQSLAFVEHKLENNKSVKLITLSEF